MEITTLEQLRLAIKTCKAVFIVPRFGMSEAWIKISKAQARSLIAEFPRDATPASVSMYGDAFGDLEDGNLYLG